jgi:hypothetical protein
MLRRRCIDGFILDISPVKPCTEFRVVILDGHSRSYIQVRLYLNPTTKIYHCTRWYITDFDSNVNFTDCFVSQHDPCFCCQCPQRDIRGLRPREYSAPGRSQYFFPTSSTNFLTADIPPRTSPSPSRIHIVVPRFFTLCSRCRSRDFR